MKKLLLSICAILALGLAITLSSCDSGKVERTISDMGYGDWDINGDGEAGRNVSFRGINKGRCQSGGTYYQRTSNSDKRCKWCGKSWSDHIGATGSAPDN